MLSKDSIPQMLICALQVPKAVVSFTRVDYDLALPIHCQYYVLQKTCKVTAGMIMENGADRVEDRQVRVGVAAYWYYFFVEGRAAG